MKKKTHINKLAALLSATALAAPVAVLADSHDENERVEVYGFVNLSVDWEGYDGFENPDDPDWNVPETEDGSLAMNTAVSHFGFRGQEELDGGLTAIYQAEVEWVYTGDGEGSPGNGEPISQVRDSFVGLEGDFGRLTLGRQTFGNQFVYDGPNADWVGQAGTAGGVLALHAPLSVPWDDVTNMDGFENVGGRLNNVVRYTSPDFGPIGVVASIVPGGNGQGDPDDHGYNMRVTYDDGAGISGAATLWHIDSFDGDEDMTLYSFGGRYEMDALTFGAQFSGRSYDHDDETDADDMGVSLGAMMPMGDTGRVKGILSHFMADESDSDYTTIAAGYDHIFSDRTELRFAVAATLNDDKTNVTPHSYDMYGPSSGVIPNYDETHTTASVNLRHSF
ncbi:porin [Halorhodospira halochloris]|uniref:porin n=1 Tax=Halorhodospira halochloris TaxID=1052 RepID=UPI001EE80303|nr:porin [Halorhodospira halochloris]MCG5531475.1 porin [Halorhodospira halochloris]